MLEGLNSTEWNGRRGFITGEQDSDGRYPVRITSYVLRLPKISSSGWIPGGTVDPCYRKIKAQNLRVTLSPWTLYANNIKTRVAWGVLREVRDGAEGGQARACSAKPLTSRRDMRLTMHTMQYVRYPYEYTGDLIPRRATSQVMSLLRPTPPAMQSSSSSER